LLAGIELPSKAWLAAVCRPAVYGPAAFTMFVLVYAAVLLLNPSYPEVDYEMLRESIWGSEATLPLAVMPEIGRFYPMFGQELRLVQWFSSKVIGVYVFYSIQFLATAWLLASLVQKTGAGARVSYLLCGTFFLLPGSTNVWVGGAATERNIVFLLAIFFLCFMAYQETKHWSLLITGLVSANLALYYKETVCVLVGSFALVHLLLIWKTDDRRVKLFDITLALSALIFLVIYALVVIPHRGSYLYGDSDGFSAWGLARVVYNYLFNDPLIVLLLFPFAILRICNIVFRHHAAHPVFDSMLVAGAAYLLAFLKLGMYATNYMLPAYVCALPAVAYVVLSENLIGQVAWKRVIAAVVVLIVTSGVPLGLHILALQKYGPVNTVLTWNKLADEIKRRPAGGRPSIFLDGVYRELTLHPPEFTYDRDAYFNFGMAMTRRGLDPLQFNLKSDLPPKYPYLFPKSGNAAYPYSVFSSSETWKPEKGDFWVIIPSSTRHITPDYLALLQKDYELLYQTESLLAIPDLSLKTMIKRSAMGVLSKSVVLDNNVSRSPNYYVFVKK